MAETLSFEKVWQMFQETDRKFQEIALQAKETDRKFQETDRKFQETDRKFQEVALQSKATDRKIQETDRIVQNLARRFGDLGNRLGEFVEAMVEPAVVRLFQQRGLDVHEVHSRARARRNGESLEVDLLVVNDGELVAVECKSRLTREAVEQHVGNLERFRRLFPKYGDMVLYGAVAGMVVDEDASELAQQRGLFVLRQSGETVEIVNPQGFEPARF